MQPRVFLAIRQARVEMCLDQIPAALQRNGLSETRYAIGRGLKPNASRAAAKRFWPSKKAIARFGADPAFIGGHKEEPRWGPCGAASGEYRKQA